MRWVIVGESIKKCLYIFFLGLLIFVQAVNYTPIIALANQVAESSSTYANEKNTETSSVDNELNSQKEEDKNKKEVTTSSTESIELKESEELVPVKDSQEETSKKETKKSKVAKSATTRAAPTRIATMDGVQNDILDLYSDYTITIREASSFNGTYKVYASYKYNNESYRVTKIADNAFRNGTENQENQNLKGLDLTYATNLEEIGKGAFYYCTKLTGKLDFSNCTSLVTIGESAFRECKGITGLEFGERSRLKTIGQTAFRACTGLGGKRVILPDSLRNVGNEAFLLWSGPLLERLEHKTVIEMNGSLPNLDRQPPVLPEEAQEYESFVDSSNQSALLHKAAKWLDEDRTRAEIRIDYGTSFDRQANLDVIFVLDNSSSMLIPAEAIGPDQEKYNYPRSFYTNDVVIGATKMLLENSSLGYNNRVALTAFGTADEPLYTTDYFTNATDVKEFLYNNPTIKNNVTNYSGGLNGALDIINDNSAVGRQPVVIFVSDGYPEDGTGNTPSENFYGLSQAQTLRNQGYRVYPISIFDDSGDSQRLNNLKNISYDGKTAYLAEDSSSFQQVMEDVLEDVVNAAVPLDVKIEDVLSREFGLVDGVNSISISDNGGTATIDGKKVLWDLTGCEEGKVHTLKLEVKIEPGTELTKSGILPTNDSLRAEDDSITSNRQPELDRYLAHHEFENETFPGKALPEEVTTLLPGSKGGFADKQTISATEITNTSVKTSDGQWWEFIGWDQEDKQIDGGDVTFVGKWKYVGYDLSFIKMTTEKRALAGVEFSLYKWTGQGSPQNNDLATTESIAQGKWTLLDVQTSQENGRVDFRVPYEKDAYYQLAETKTPARYRQPTGQWRFTFDENGRIKDNALVGIVGPDGESPPNFEVIAEGAFAGLLGLINEDNEGMLPATGFKGTLSFAVGAAICWIIGIGGCSAMYLLNRKRK